MSNDLEAIEKLCEQLHQDAIADCNDPICRLCDTTVLVSDVRTLVAYARRALRVERAMEKYKIVGATWYEGTGWIVRRDTPDKRIGLTMGDMPMLDAVLALAEKLEKEPTP